ncbi:MFS transporter [Natronosporangium hydrolyticum]|uniref:MFS transporter n=1 Tax=Natronosporangium hydrolyticum TaxID=2811111 RepID=A0A895YLR4_9ACTN|nr:MFS transporter [Natronosporangium hydrolyticum]QSB16905.1 MFS transporter [Natronosporangium hydrolyticum]
MTATPRRWRGGCAHRVYSVVVFIVLAALDNVAIALPPPLLSPISRDLGVAEPVVAAAVAVNLLLTAVAAVAWAYVGDRGNRKRLLLVGTLMWTAGIGATTVVGSYPAFLAAQAFAGIGLGAVASVGFSVVSDLITPRRRGLVMGLWGLSQGVGTLAGVALAGVLGAADWRTPFRVLTIVGLVATFAYLFTYDIRRGQSEPALRALYESGGEYDHRISRADLPRIAARRTNLWLVAQGLTAQLAFGSLVWLPRLFQAKVEDLGYAESTAIVVGSVFTVMLLSGGVLSLVGALVGDRLQRRTPRGRALVAAVGVLAATPLFVALVFFPLRLELPAADPTTGEIVVGLMRSLVTEPTMAATFLVALVALALVSAQSPNWFALVVEVNPPEHRGTVFSAGNLVNGVGRTLGTYLVVRSFEALERSLPPPLNFAVGLAAFQLFFIPTGVMYWRASRSAPADIAEVDRMLVARATLPAGAGGRSGEQAGEQPVVERLESDPPVEADGPVVVDRHP